MLPMWADVVYGGSCLQTRQSWSRSAMTTQAGVFLLPAWRSPPCTSCNAQFSRTLHADSSSRGMQKKKLGYLPLMCSVRMWADVVFVGTM